MPIYEYECSKCKRRIEVICRISDMAKGQICDECGEGMERIISLPQPAIFIVTNRDNVVKMLNNEGGYSLPGNNKHGERYKSVIGGSLKEDKPVIGRGFA
jgi:putative FmdB family regulatory protein